MTAISKLEMGRNEKPLGESKRTKMKNEYPEQPLNDRSLALQRPLRKAKWRRDFEAERYRRAIVS